jgi:Uri superfamily endonuclease
MSLCRRDGKDGLLSMNEMVAAGIPRSPGSYVLVLQLTRPRRIRIGRLGILAFPEGAYAYTGSAFGPGGLRARVRHHLRRSVRPHWHLDYLRRLCTAQDVWFVEGERLECVWADRLVHNKAAVPVPGFGCTDCRCRSHLFGVTRVNEERIIKSAASKVVVRYG